jgi:8-oxo-dGTP diphosphatase
LHDGALGRECLKGRTASFANDMAPSAEEVGIDAEIIAFNRHVEAIYREDERIRTHFVIVSFVARWTRGEPRISDEVDAVEWIDPAAPLPSPTTPELSEVLTRAARMETQSA